jgi:hypothetical protein
MYQRALLEHLPGRLPERLAAIEDEQDRLPGIEAAVNEVSKKRPRQCRVLKWTLPTGPAGP